MRFIGISFAAGVAILALSSTVVSSFKIDCPSGFVTDMFALVGNSAIQEIGIQCQDGSKYSTTSATGQWYQNTIHNSDGFNNIIIEQAPGSTVKGLGYEPAAPWGESVMGYQGDRTRINGNWHKLRGFEGEQISDSNGRAISKLNPIWQ